jgi:uncharacterized protein YndB with AHSA1/START domain
MAAKANARAAAESHELVLTRVFDARRELVFKAWTEREYLMQWSAPHGFTVTESDGELRAGGSYRAAMRSPEGEVHRLGGVYKEIVAPERLVFTHAWEGDDGKLGHATEVTVTLEDLGGKTKMTFRQTGFESAASRDGHQGGWSEAFGRLAALVEKK